MIRASDTATLGQQLSTPSSPSTRKPSTILFRVCKQEEQLTVVDESSAASEAFWCLHAVAGERDCALARRRRRAFPGSS